MEKQVDNSTTKTVKDTAMAIWNKCTPKTPANKMELPHDVENPPIEDDKQKRKQYYVQNSVPAVFHIECEI